MPLSQTGSPYSCKTSNQSKRQRRACDEEDKEKGRFGANAFVRKGILSEADFQSSNVAAAITKILAAEAVCDAYVLRDTSGAYDGGAPVTGKSGGRQKEKDINIVHTLTLADLEYVGNESFWEFMKGSANQWDWVGWTSSRAWPVIGPELKISPKGPIGDDPDVDIEGEITVSYSRNGLLKSYASDLAALNVAPFLPLLSLAVGGTSTATIGVGALDTTVTIAKATELDLVVRFTGALTYEKREGVKLPGTLVVTPQGSLVGQVPLPGTYTVHVRGENSCGVLGEVEVTLIVI